MTTFFLNLKNVFNLTASIVFFFPYLIAGWYFQKFKLSKMSYGQRWLVLSPLMAGKDVSKQKQETWIKNTRIGLLWLSQSSLFSELKNWIKSSSILPQSFLKHIHRITTLTIIPKGNVLIRHCLVTAKYGKHLLQEMQSLNSSEGNGPDIAIKKQRLMLQTALACGDIDKSDWWQFLTKDCFFSTNDLLHLMKNYILRQRGSYTEFIEFMDKWSELLSAPNLKTDFNYELAVHFSQALDNIQNESLFKDHAASTDRRKILLGVSVWGEHYVNIFTNYCLPSLLAAGNFPAINNCCQPILLIHTDIESKKRLHECKIFDHLKKVGVCVYFRILDKNLTKRISENPDNVYWHLGMVQSLDLFYAQSINADYHLLMPDTIYANNFFTGMINATKDGTKAITRICYRATTEGMCPDLDKLIKGNILSAPAGKLAALGIRHLHPGFKSVFVTDTPTNTHLPHVHVLIWEGENSLHLISPHQTILFLDRSLVQQIPKRFFTTLDSELDKVIPEKCNHKCPNAKDEMFLIEVTSKKVAYSHNRSISVEEFCRRFWHNSPSLSFRRFLEGDVIDNFAREDIKDLNRAFMTEQKILAEKNRLRKTVISSFPKVETKKIAEALSLMTELDSQNGSSAQRKLAEIVIADLKIKKI